MRNACIAYKTVFKSNKGRYESAVRSYKHKPVSYEVGKITRPFSDDNQFLFIFQTLKDARSFRRSRIRAGHNFLSILKVVADGVRHRAKMHDNDIYLTTSGFPRGTMFCSSLIPVEAVR